MGSQLWMNVSKNQGVSHGDRIATLSNSKADIHFESGHKITLGENSQIILEENLNTGSKQLKINLISGVLEASKPIDTTISQSRTSSASSAPPKKDYSSFEIVSKNEVFSLSNKIKSIGISAQNSNSKATIFKVNEGSKHDTQLNSIEKTNTPPTLSPFDLSLSAKLSKSIQKELNDNISRTLVDTGFEPELKSQSLTYWSYDFKDPTEIKSFTLDLSPSQKKTGAQNWRAQILLSDQKAKKSSTKLSANEGEQNSIIISASLLKKHATFHPFFINLSFKLGASYNLNGENIESFRSKSELITIRSLTSPLAKSFTLKFDEVLKSPRRQSWYQESNSEANLTHHLHLYDGRLFPRAALSIKGLNEFKIVEPASTSPYSAAFIIKGNRIIGHFSGASLQKAEYKRFLDLFAADIIFSGPSDAFLQNFSVEKLDTSSTNDKKLYIISKGKLVDLSSSFIKEKARLLSFMAEQKNIIFTQPVKVLAAKR